MKVIKNVFEDVSYRLTRVDIKVIFIDDKDLFKVHESA